MMPGGFFPAVEADAPVRPLLERLRPAVQAEIERYGEAGVAVHAELRAARTGAGDAVLDRFYWSSQRVDGTAPFGFGARTLHRDGSSEVVRVHEFPSDPALTWLDGPDGPLRRRGRPEHVDVLRYIPLRRVTFRLHDGPGLPDRVIVKAKGAGGLTRAAVAFLAVNRATARRTTSTRVPRVLRLEPPRHALYLEELPGEPLPGAIARLDVADAMEQLATVHRDLHGLAVKGLPVRRTGDWLHESRRAAEGIGLFAPSVAGRARAVHAELARTAPDEGRLSFCQGDFLPGQVLCHDEGWSVIDFDDSHYADPLAEVAGMYVGLSRELGLAPEVAEHARRTYLEAYVARAGEPFDRSRWQWYLVLVRLTQLAKRLRKGRVAPGEVTAVLDRLDADDGLA
jgi:aminoglycoside phosphotransferase